MILMDEIAPKLIKIPDNYDTMAQKNYLREYAEAYYPLVDLVLLDREQTIVDDLYIEATAKRFKAPKPIRCYVEHNPTKKSLKKYGLEQTRDVLFKITTMHLADIGYLQNNSVWMIGDLIKWGSDFYEIKDQIPDNNAYWATTNIPFYYVLAADYYRAGV